VCIVACFQLFMIGSIRDYILTAEGAADESIEAEEMDDKLENEVSDIVITCRCVGMLYQCFSTGVLRNLRVPPVVSKGSVGTPVLSIKIKLSMTFVSTSRIL